MAKGSVRKKGKKWYGRFYIEDESGRKVQTVAKSLQAQRARRKQKPCSAKR